MKRCTLGRGRLKLFISDGTQEAVGHKLMSDGQWDVPSDIRLCPTASLTAVGCFLLFSTAAVGRRTYPYVRRLPMGPSDIILPTSRSKSSGAGGGGAGFGRISGLGEANRRRSSGVGVEKMVTEASR
jgi:hypothetical protein